MMVLDAEARRPMAEAAGGGLGGGAELDVEDWRPARGARRRRHSHRQAGAPHRSAGSLADPADSPETPGSDELLRRPRSAPEHHSPGGTRRMASLLPRVKVRNFLEDYSDVDPSKFHFYDFGIQDFLVMRQHITLEEDTDESSSGGDYNQGLGIDPCTYLSDSEASTGSVDLSAEQVVWEKRLVECPAALLKNRLRHASYKKSNSSHEVRRGRRGGRPLRRRASDNLISRPPVCSPLLRLATDAVCWSSDTDIVLQNESTELEIGEDCGSGSSLGSQTNGRPYHYQNNTLPPVVTEWERPVQCSAADQELCRRAQPCLTHALLLAGLPGGGPSGRRQLSTARSAHRLRPAVTAANTAAQTPERNVPAATAAGATNDEGDGDGDGQPAPSSQPAEKDTRPALQPSPLASNPQPDQDTPRSSDSPPPPPRQRQRSHVSSASLSSLVHSDLADTLADMVDEPPQMTALERKLIMKKHPMLRNDTNAHILAPPDFRIGMK